MRLAMTLLVEGGSEVPVAMSLSVEAGLVGEEGESACVREKKRRGTFPQVSGPMNDATADWPGCRKRENLCTLFGVLPAFEKSFAMLVFCDGRVWE
jgi:hypothetical protein